jgi:hypothetical protein
MKRMHTIFTVHRKAENCGRMLGIYLATFVNNQVFLLLAYTENSLQTVVHKAKTFSKIVIFIFCLFV